MVVEALALGIRKQRAEDGWDNGPLSVRARLLELADHGEYEDLFKHTPVPSRATLARIFTRHGAVTPAPNKRPHASYRRFTFPRVHDCWQLDATEWQLADGRKVVIFQLEDDHSRYIVASQVAWSENSAAALAVMQAAVAAHQAPVLLLTDNLAGDEPVPAREDLRARRLRGQPGHPRDHQPRSTTRTPPKNERLHATLKPWLRARPLPASIQELTDWLTGFDRHYNHRRSHQSLHGRTPAQVLATAAHALPPDPPPPPPPPPPAMTTPATPRRSLAEQLTRVRVIPNGSARVRGGYYVGLGVEHAGSHVLALVDTTTITIFDMHGTELLTRPDRPRTDLLRHRPTPRRPPPPGPVTHSKPNQPSGPN